MTRPVPTQKPAAAPPVLSQDLRLDLRAYLIRGENPAELQTVTQAFLDRYHPLGVVEEMLVSSMILAQWNKKRWGRLETQLVDSASGLLALLRDPASNALFKQVQRRVAAEEGRHFRALAELRRLQKERSASESPKQQKETKPVAENWLRSVKSPNCPVSQSGAGAFACQPKPDATPSSHPADHPVERSLLAS